MITIALDEGGKFEFDSNRQGKDEISMIGGVLFQYADRAAYEAELDRLQSFFKSACRKQGATYPQDLHPLRDRNNNNIIKNVTEMNRVKKALAMEMSQFLTGKGAWETWKPAGQYYLYALASDRQGRKELTARGLSNLIDDNVASNRYEHMAYRTVENLLFYNPVIEDNDMNLQFATRSLPVKRNDPDQENFEALGYAVNGRGAYYHITDASGYRAALATAIQNSSRKNIQFDMSVESISYESSDDNWYQGFLYLADTMCSIYQDDTSKATGIADALQCLTRTGNRIMGPGRTLLYSYSAIDDKYRRAFRMVDVGNYFEALKAMKVAELGHMRGAGIYRRLWFDALEKRMVEKATPDSLQTALEKLDRWLEQPDYSLLAAEHIHSVLSGMADRLPKDSLGSALLFRLYCSAIRISNHKGDFAAAMTAYKKCVPMAQYVSVEDYLELRNLYTVALQDSGKKEEALTFLADTVAYEEKLVKLRKEIMPDNDIAFVHYGRSLSQKGQALSFAGRYDEAAESFEKALAAFGGDKKEREFTMSLYLHALIEKGDRVTYEKYAEEYFGSCDRNRQLEYICGKPKDRAPRFMLYVYCKAEVLLYGDRLKGKNIQNLLDSVTRKYQAQEDAHPWEMIFKYCAFMALISSNGRDMARAEELMDKSRACVSNSKDGILLKIVEENDRQFNALCKGKALREIYAASPLNYMYR